jgi:hypothetical protein
MLTVRVDDSQLQRKIAQWSVITGRTIKEETRTVFKGMVRDAIKYTPPGSQNNTGSRAKQFGELAISRDLWRMGFRPAKKSLLALGPAGLAIVEQLGGEKVYTKTFWGHTLKNPPLIIPIKPNPKFSNPEAFRRARLASKHGGRVSRGGRQPFYVSAERFTPMRDRLILEVGRLASGWVNAANQLGVPVPAWISRHSETFNRGTQLIITETKNRITMRVTNTFPSGTEQAGITAQMIRLIETFIKPAALGRLQRQIDFNLKKGFRAAR